MFIESDVHAAALPAFAGARPIRVDDRDRDRRVADWDSLAESLQVRIAAAALRRAAATIAFQAEALAREMEAGGLEDRGGPDALRLLSAIARVTSGAG